MGTEQKKWMWRTAVDEFRACQRRSGHLDQLSTTQAGASGQEEKDLQNLAHLWMIFVRATATFLTFSIQGNLKTRVEPGEEA